MVKNAGEGVLNAEYSKGNFGVLPTLTVATGAMVAHPIQGKKRRCRAHVGAGRMIPISDAPGPRRTFPVVTVLLIAINVLVFVFELGMGDQQLERVITAAGVVPAEILSGRDLGPRAPLGIIYLTLLTSMFLHAGFLHIGGNMLYLWVFGDNVEDSMGHLRFLVFYLLCGILAGLTHILLNAGSTEPSIGASGAIAGVLGAYIVLFPHAKVRTLLFIGPFITFPRVSAWIMIGIWFLLQLFSGLASLGPSSAQSSGVAFWAHVGGFVAGLVLVFVFRRRDPGLA